MNFLEHFYQQLQELPQRETQQFPPGSLPENYSTAVVLIPLWPTDSGQIEIVFTKRTDTLPTHGGQVSFPGGRIHADDTSLEMTALRETNEELGILPEQVKIMGRLDDAWSLQGHHVIPYVGWLDSRPDIYPEPGEVAEVIITDVETLLRPETATEHEHIIGDSRHITRAFSWEGGYVWGLTADILQELLLWVRGEQSNRGNQRLKMLRERLAKETE